MNIERSVRMLKFQIFFQCWTGMAFACIGGAITLWIGLDAFIAAMRSRHSTYAMLSFLSAGLSFGASYQAWTTFESSMNLRRAILDLIKATLELQEMRKLEQTNVDK